MKPIIDEQASIARQSLQPYLDTLQSSLLDTLAPLAESLDRATQEIRKASQEVGPALTSAGFWIPPSAPMTMVRELRVLASRGEATPELTRRLIVGTYHADDFRFLRSIVTSSSAHPLFTGSALVIAKAADAHLRSEFTLSIPALLPLVEGSLITYLGRRFSAREGGTSGMASTALRAAYGDAMREATIDAILQYITGHGTYGRVDPVYFHPDRYSKWLSDHGLESTQILNRHAILHGIQRAYSSPENSLRAFFLIDSLTLLEYTPSAPRSNDTQVAA
ncbi:MAG: hypothetical protein WD906_00060 [Anaerolineales bacterium]